MALPRRQLEAADCSARRLRQRARADFSAPPRPQQRLGLVVSAHRPPRRLSGNRLHRRVVCLAALPRRRLRVAASSAPLRLRREVYSEPPPLHSVELAVVFLELRSQPPVDYLEPRPPPVRLLAVDSLARARPPRLRAAACLERRRLPAAVFSALLHRPPGVVFLVAVWVCLSQTLALSFPSVLNLPSR